MRISKCVQLALVIPAVVVCSVCDIGDDELEDISTFVRANSNVTVHATISAAEITARYGYKFESHKVVTQDGYILALHRIPSGCKGSTKRGPVIYLQHGILGCSADWIVQGPGKALALILADQGYDVWLGNARGTTESKKHESLNITDPAFWNFSWHEIGYYDVPANIDYILKKTGKKTLSYIGYSQGTTVFWVLGSERPEYISKMNKMIALAPVAYFERVESGLFKSLASFASNMEWALKSLGSLEFLPTSTFMSWASQTYCTDAAWTQTYCKNVVFLLFGFSKHLNASLIPTIFGYSPAGASTKQVLHYAQLIRQAPVFRQYDYGWVGNILVYRSLNPPNYELSRISVPVHMFLGPADWIATEMDARRIYNAVKKPGKFIIVRRKDFNHVDFLLASDARELIYNDVLQILKKGSNDEPIDKVAYG